MKWTTDMNIFMWTIFLKTDGSWWSLTKSNTAIYWLIASVFSTKVMFTRFFTAAYSYLTTTDCKFFFFSIYLVFSISIICTILPESNQSESHVKVLRNLFQNDHTHPPRQCCEKLFQFRNGPTHHGLLLINNFFYIINVLKNECENLQQ